MTSSQRLLTQSWLEHLICIASFFAASWLTDPLFEIQIMDRRWVVILACALSFAWQLGSYPRARGLGLLEPFMIGSGLVLMVGAVSSYFEFSESLQLPTVAIGATLTMLGCGTLRSLRVHQEPPHILLIGAGKLIGEIMQHFPKQVLGIIEPAPGMNRIEELLKQHRPTHIVVDVADKEVAPLMRVLLDFKLSGCIVDTASTASERLFERIHLATFGMENILRAETLRANRRVMALQAVYSNPIGLFLLLTLAPVLIILGVVSRQAAGGSGPLFERVECAGFQGIPFRRRRFRVRHCRTGKKTAVGRWIERWGIVNLPQIVNLNRGEMALFGPQPVRLAFSDYLDEISPLHSHRLSVKPGIFGWEQIHAASAHSLPEEHIRMGYEFFYVERGSLILDIQILLRSLWSFRRGLWAGF